MGCDIHAFVEKRNGDSWKFIELDPEPFDCRDYRLFGFLADVRNYSHSPVISKRRGIPGDASEHVLEMNDYWDSDGHSHTWLLLRELLDFDYNQEIWDQRVMKQDGPNSWNGAALAEEGEGAHLRLGVFLGEWYFKELNRFKQLGPPEDTRIVFWFDN